jgi:hypothetical protein
MQLLLDKQITSFSIFVVAASGMFLVFIVTVQSAVARPPHSIELRTIEAKTTFFYDATASVLSVER